MSTIDAMLVVSHLCPSYGGWLRVHPPTRMTCLSVEVKVSAPRCHPPSLRRVPKWVGSWTVRWNEQRMDWVCTVGWLLCHRCRKSMGCVVLRHRAAFHRSYYRLFHSKTVRRSHSGGSSSSTVSTYSNLSETVSCDNYEQLLHGRCPWCDQPKTKRKEERIHNPMT